MRKRLLTCLLCACTVLTGCSHELKLEHPATMSTNVDSYVNAVKAEKYNISGAVTLETGDYVVYPNTGTTCMIDDGSTGQEFESRDFIHIEDPVSVTISNGYLLPLDKAPALNGNIVTDGVYLVGFDMLPERNKVGMADMVVVSDKIPTLFQKADKTSYAKYDAFESNDGMLVKISGTHVTDRPEWDVQERTSLFWGSYVNTAIDAVYDSNTEQTTKQANYLTLYNLYLESLQMTGTIVKLDSDEDVTFSYKGSKYTLPYGSAYTIISDSDKITTDDSTTVATQSYSEFRESGEDETGITTDNSQLFYILGDFYTPDTVKEVSDADTLSMQYITPDDTEVQTAKRASDLEEGYVIVSQVAQDYHKLSDSEVALYDALTADLTESATSTLTKSSVTSVSTIPAGCYKVSDGKLSNSQFEYSLTDNGVRFTVDGDYVVLYSDDIQYTALEDTKLEGATFKDIVSYYKDVASGDKTITDTEPETYTHTKSYNLEADKEYSIGSTMSANVYTFPDYSTVTVYPYATRRPHVYTKCYQVILQAGDVFKVDADTVVTSQVTDAMEESERLAAGEALGLVPKTYTIQSSFVAGVDMPVLEYTVNGNTTVHIGDSTYTSGSVFTPAMNDVVTVDEPCDISAMEPTGVVQTDNRYDVFNSTATCGTDIPAGIYTLVGGTLSVGDKTYSTGDTVELTDGDITSQGWFCLQITEDMESTE